MNKERNITRQESTSVARDDVPFRTPAVDICETPDELILFADMPGVDEKGLDVVIEENTLTISGKKASAAPENAELLYAEFDPYGFRRVFTLSNDLQLDAVEGRIKNGVLKLTLPKAQGAKIRRIPIKTE